MSKIHHFLGRADDFDWEGAFDYPVSEDGLSKGARGKILIGSQDSAPYFVFRYFRIEPGGHSTLDDYHAHDHGVVILHGRARLRLGEREYDVGPHDVIYIQPWERHSLATSGDEPLGFLCVIPNKEMLSKLESPKPSSKELE
jgi:quercetin dioxygenase-like cupin family protein